MSRLRELADYLETLPAAARLAPDGILTGGAPHAAGAVLCDEGETSATHDVAGNRTALHAYALYVRAAVLTQAERDAQQDACEALCAQINAAALPVLAHGSVQDMHCGGAQLAAQDDSGFCTSRIPLWLEITQGAAETLHGAKKQAACCCVR